MQTLVRRMLVLCLLALPALLASQTPKRLTVADTIRAHVLTDSGWKDALWITHYDTLPDYKPGKVARVFNTAFLTITFPYEAPSVVLHENMHKLAFKAFGVSSKIEYQSFKPWADLDYKQPLAWTAPNEVDYYQRIAGSKWKEDVVGLAPYVVGDLLIKDRLVEGLVRKLYHPDMRGLGSFSVFLGSESLTILSIVTPLESATPGADVWHVATRHGINRWIIAGALEAAYMYSSYRIMRTSICGNAHCHFQY